MLSSRLPEPSFAPEQVLDCLGAIALGIHQTLSLDNILNTVVQEAHKLLQTDRVLIYRFQPDESGVVIAESVGSNWTSALSQTIYDPCFTSTWAQAYRQGHFSAIADIYASGIQPCYAELLSQFQVQATLVVPILLNTLKLDSSAKEYRIQNSEFTIGLNSSSNNWEPFNSLVELPSPPDSCILTPDSNSCQNPNSKIQNQLWGLLIAHQCSSPRQWQPLEVKLLQQIAVQMAIAIGQTELYQQTQAELQQRQQAQDELKRQKDFLRNVIDTNPNLICVKDWEGRFRLVNQALADIYGTTIEDLTDKTDADFNANQAEVEHYLQDDRQVMTSRQPKFIPEETLTSPNGQVHYLQTIKKPLLSSDGQICYVLATATDITERKRAEQERNNALLERERALIERHRAAIERNRAAIALRAYIRTVFKSGVYTFSYRFKFR